MFQLPGNMQNTGEECAVNASSVSNMIHATYKKPEVPFFRGNPHQFNFSSQSRSLTPMNQIHSVNQYVDTAQRFPQRSNHQMMPIFQSTDGYNGQNPSSNRHRFIRPSAVPVARNYPSVMMAPPPSPGRAIVNANDRSRRSENSAVEFQGPAPLVPLRTYQKVPSENRTTEASSSRIQEAVPGTSRTSLSAPPPDESQCTGSIGNLNVKVYGSTDAEKMFIFTGTVEKVIKWQKIFCNQFCYFEVIASVVSIQEGSVKTQKIILLRDKKGPVLQVVFYATTHLDLQDFYIGQMIRCVGKMNGQNVLNAITIRCASQGEIENLQRLCLICDQAVSHFLQV